MCGLLETLYTNYSNLSLIHNQDLIKPLYTIKHKSIFAAKKFLTKTCNIMILYCRDFDKVSKKYLFVILGFFYNL